MGIAGEKVKPKVAVGRTDKMHKLCNQACPRLINILSEHAEADFVAFFVSLSSGSTWMGSVN